MLHHTATAPACFLGPHFSPTISYLSSFENMDLYRASTSYSSLSSCKFSLDSFPGLCQNNVFFMQFSLCFACLVYSSMLNVQAVGYSQTSVNFQQTTWYQIRKDKYSLIYAPVMFQKSQVAKSYKSNIRIYCTEGFLISSKNDSSRRGCTARPLMFPLVIHTVPYSPFSISLSSGQQAVCINKKVV